MTDTASRKTVQVLKHNDKRARSLRGTLSDKFQYKLSIYYAISTPYTLVPEIGAKIILIAIP